MRIDLFPVICCQVLVVQGIKVCLNASDIRQERYCSKGCCGTNISNSLPCCSESNPRYNDVESNKSVYITFFYSVMGFVVVLHFIYCCRRISRLREKFVTNQNRHRCIRIPVNRRSTQRDSNEQVDHTPTTNQLVQDELNIGVTISPPSYEDVIKSSYDDAPPSYDNAPPSYNEIEINDIEINEIDIRSADAVVRSANS